MTTSPETIELWLTELDPENQEGLLFYYWDDEQRVELATFIREAQQAKTDLLSARADRDEFMRLADEWAERCAQLENAASELWLSHESSGPAKSDPESV